MGTPDFDLAALEKIARQLGEVRFREIVGIFLENTPERLQRVQSGLSSGDLDDPAEASRLVDLGVCSVITNHPDRIEEALYS